MGTSSHKLHIREDGVKLPIQYSKPVGLIPKEDGVGDGGLKGGASWVDLHVAGLLCLSHVGVGRLVAPCNNDYDFVFLGGQVGVYVFVIDDVASCEAQVNIIVSGMHGVVMIP